MAGCQFTIRVEGSVSVVTVSGHLDDDTARHLLETVAAAAKVSRAVQIDLGEVQSISPEGAALLLFGSAPGKPLPDNIVLRANGQPGRRAVLQAFAGQRARSQAS